MYSCIALGLTSQCINVAHCDYFTSYYVNVLSLFDFSELLFYIVTTLFLGARLVMVIIMLHKHVGLNMFPVA